MQTIKHLKMLELEFRILENPISKKVVVANVINPIHKNHTLLLTKDVF